MFIHTALPEHHFYSLLYNIFLFNLAELYWMTFNLYDSLPIWTVYWMNFNQAELSTAWLLAWLNSMLDDF